MEIDTDTAYWKWKSDFENLLDEINLCMLRFEKIKKCNCMIAECKHFEKERDRIFGNRINDLFNISLKNSVQTLTEIKDSTRGN